MENNIIGCWKCIFMEDTMKGKNCNPETFFLEIRNVKNTVREIETHIDIADYKESLLLRGKITKTSFCSLSIDIRFPEEIVLRCNFFVTKKKLHIKWYGMSKNILKTVFERQQKHLF